MATTRREQAHQLMLLEKMTELRVRNPSFSLRALARKVGLSPALLSQLISGARPLTLRSAAKIIDGLEIPPAEAERLRRSIRPRGKQQPAAQRQVVVLSDDAFRTIADWHHYAILSLSDIPDNRAAPTWIAKRLGITPVQAKAAYARLETLSLVKRDGKGFKRASGEVETTRDIPSAAIRSHHRQFLEKACDSLVKDPVDARYFGSVTIAMDPDELPRFKEMLRGFRQEFRTAAGATTKRRVYQFGLHLFPLDQGE